MRRTFFRLVWTGIGALLTVLLIEAVLRFLPVTMGIYRTTQFERWPLQNSEPHRPYANSTTWALLNSHRGITNNYGHIAPFDYVKNSRPILVLGDSFIESLMHEYADTLQGQLGEKINAPKSVYGLGVSGLSASDYVALSHLAKAEFNPIAAIFLITDGDFSESLRPRSGNYYVVPDGDLIKLGYLPLKNESFMQKIRKTVGDSALYRYLQANLQFAPENMIKAFRAQSQPVFKNNQFEKNIETQRKVADWLLAELPTALGLPPECIVFLIDSDRYAIYQTQLASPRKDNPAIRAHFITQAQQLGFKVSDLDPLFRQIYAQDHTKFDYWPIDRHWNRTGHNVGAEEAYRRLFTDGKVQRQACLSGWQAPQ